MKRRFNGMKKISMKLRIPTLTNTQAKGAYTIMRTNVTLLLAVCIALISCNGCSEKKGAVEPNLQEVQLDLIKQAKKDHERETKSIKTFIEAKKWPMLETKSGLHYWIYENGTGSQANLEDRVFVSYHITLLDGTECYQTTDANPKQFVVGMDNVETGLHEALQLMKVGDKAKFILPSHLAFGFTGDSGKIPKGASVVYDIHLLKLN